MITGRSAVKLADIRIAGRPGKVVIWQLEVVKTRCYTYMFALVILTTLWTYSYHSDIVRVKMLYCQVACAAASHMIRFKIMPMTKSTYYWQCLRMIKDTRRLILLRDLCILFHKTLISFFIIVDFCYKMRYYTPTSYQCST